MLHRFFADLGQIEAMGISLIRLQNRYEFDRMKFGALHGAMIQKRMPAEQRPAGGFYD